ncbi:MAG: hypothetical protein Q4F84_04890 [Fibrobacter sp.]|nr:hypothetical protein [Fibrobacter sp.]
MVYWIKKLALILAFFVFFALLFVNLSNLDSFEFENMIMSVIKSFFGAALFWFTGFIIGDIFLKGIVTDIEHDEMNGLEGGMIQRIDMKKQDLVPGGVEMPFVEEVENGVKGARRVKSSK